MPDIQEWQEKLLARAKEIWEAGEGEIVFTVFTRPPNRIKEYKIEGGKIERGKENTGS